MFWGRQLQQLAKNVTADAINATLASMQYRQGAQRASQAMQSNDGVAKAIQLLHARIQFDRGL